MTRLSSRITGGQLTQPPSQPGLHYYSKQRKRRMVFRGALGNKAVYIVIHFKSHCGICRQGLLMIPRALYTSGVSPCSEHFIILFPTRMKCLDEPQPLIAEPVLCLYWWKSVDVWLRTSLRWKHKLFIWGTRQLKVILSLRSHSEGAGKLKSDVCALAKSGCIRRTERTREVSQTMKMNDLYGRLSNPISAILCV